MLKIAGMSANPTKEVLTCLQNISDLAEKCLLTKLENVAEEISNWNSVLCPSKEVVGSLLDAIITSLDLIVSQQHHEEHHVIIQKHKQLLVPVISLIGEHQQPDKPWTSDELMGKCHIVMNRLSLLLHTDCGEDIAGIFNKDFKLCITPRKSLFFLCLQSLRQKLKSSTWKYFPAAVTSFAWVAIQVKYPDLSDFVGDVLAPSLLLLDDYNDENALLGIAVVGHIINNVNKADLIKDNWVLVLYNALHGPMYNKNPAVIDGMIPLLISVLQIMEVNPNANSHKFTKYDETMKKMLFALDMCTERPLKYTWVKQITSYLEILGHATLHWNSKICDSILFFTSTNDDELWIAMLKCLQVQVKNTWLRPNSTKIAEIILRLVLNCSALDFPNIPQEKRAEIIDLARNTMKLMENCSDYENVKKEIEIMKQNREFHKDFLQTLQSF